MSIYDVLDTYNNVTSLLKTVRGAKNKGWIMNTVSGTKKSFIFNPTTFEHGKGATYAETSSPGMSYPMHQYVKGEARVFSIELYMYHNTGVAGDVIANMGNKLNLGGNPITEFVSFLEEFMPPDNDVAGYTKPPELIFCYGSFIKRCVMQDLKLIYTRYSMTGTPIEAKAQITLRQVGTS